MGGAILALMCAERALADGELDGFVDVNVFRSREMLRRLLLQRPVMS